MAHSKEAYRSPEFGSKITSVLFGVSQETLSDYPLLEQSLLDALKKDRFTILDVRKRYFDPEGMTIVVVLGESHAAIHTYHEHNSMSFEVSSCRGPTDGMIAFQHFISKIPHRYHETEQKPYRIAEPKEKRGTL